MKTSRLYIGVSVASAAMLLALGSALAQQGPAGCAWNKYLYAQDATQQGQIDTNLLNQRYEPSQPDECHGFGPRLFADEQGLAVVQWLADGSKAP